MLIPAIGDDQVVNTEYFPVYRDLPGSYSWGPIIDGHTQIEKGGTDK